MRNTLVFISLLILKTVTGQGFNFGESTTLKLSSSATFFAGGDISFEGTLINEGEIVMSQDVDFGSNSDVGRLSFVGDEKQQVIGDSLVIEDLEVDKTENLEVMTNWSIVSGSLDVTNGVVSSGNTQLTVTGTTSATGNGFVEGPMRGVAGGGDLVFPVGLNGFQNYLTIRGLATGTAVLIECKTPDSETLLPNDDMIGIADEMEWVIVLTAGGSGEATLAADFDGIDLNNLVNANTIRAFEYDPAIAVFSEGDSVYRTLNSLTISDTDESTFGFIDSNDEILLNEDTTHVSIAIVPVQIRPTFYVPNSFAPAGTLLENQEFRPYFTGASISSLSFSVFDAFNNEVHRYLQNGDDVDIALSGWQGIVDQGDEAPEGVYYFQVNILAEGQQYQKTGSVLLVR